MAGPRMKLRSHEASHVSFGLDDVLFLVCIHALKCGEGKWDYLHIYCNTFSVYHGVYDGPVDDDNLGTALGWYSDHSNEEKPKSSRALVEKDVVGLGWSVVDYGSNDFFHNPHDYFCKHFQKLD